MQTKGLRALSAFIEKEHDVQQGLRRDHQPMQYELLLLPRTQPSAAADEHGGILFGIGSAGGAYPIHILPFDGGAVDPSAVARVYQAGGGAGI